MATTTEIHDHLRLLYAKVGHPHCPECGEELLGHEPGAAAEVILSAFAGTKGRVVAPLFVKGKERCVGDGKTHAAERHPTVIG